MCWHVHTYVHVHVYRYKHMFVHMHAIFSHACIYASRHTAAYMSWHTHIWARAGASKGVCELPSACTLTPYLRDEGSLPLLMRVTPNLQNEGTLPLLTTWAAHARKHAYARALTRTDTHARTHTTSSNTCEVTNIAQYRIAVCQSQSPMNE